MYNTVIIMLKFPTIIMMKIFNTAEPYPDTFLFLLAIMIVCKDQNYITLHYNLHKYTVF